MNGVKNVDEVCSTHFIVHVKLYYSMSHNCASTIFLDMYKKRKNNPFLLKTGNEELFLNYKVVSSSNSQLLLLLKLNICRLDATE